MKGAPAHPADRGSKSLTLFLIYRLVVAILLVSPQLSSFASGFLGQRSPDLYTLVSFSYLGTVVASALALYWQSISNRSQALLMVFIDIAAITLLMHASGGPQTGLGMLLAVSIAAGSMLLPGATGLLFASIASLSVLAQQVTTLQYYGIGATAFPQSGLLGAAFFAIATLSHVLSKRIFQSEQRVSQSELDLANMAQLNDYVIQHMQTGILVVDTNGNLRLLNQSAWYLLGMPDATVGTPLRAACPQLQQRMDEWQQDHKPGTRSFHPLAGGKELQCGFSRLDRGGSSGGTVVFIEDAASVTQRAQQLKLASLGRLTASIAHEIRNPLGAIGHAGQLLDESSQLPAADQRLLEIINSNTRRVNEIIENVLQLSRRSQSRPEEFLLQTWLQEFTGDFRLTHALHEQQLILHIEPPSTQIFTDPSQLRQIFNNLCENALNHFDRPLDQLRIQIVGGIAERSSGPFVDLIDNGTGITSEIAKQIFEPFFTTESRGTGLGLYIARELSESNRMRLEYIPIATGGSCFRMTFPGVRGNETMP